MERSWRQPGKKTGGLTAAGRFLRLSAVIGMAAMLAGPAVHENAPRSSAAALEWSDARPPLSDEADSTAADGFRHLPDFGNALHAITVAPNGDIFAAGTGAEVDASGNGACFDGVIDAIPLVGESTADAVDSNFDDDGDCDVAGAVPPVVFKSTDGGVKWRSARVSGAGAGTTIHKIVVSPDYPTDDFVGVVFTTGISDDAFSNRNGIAWSFDAGLTFSGGNTIDGSDAGVEPDLDDVLWTTIALSPDFNFNDGNGEIAIGGWWVAGPTTAVIATAALKSFPSASTVNDIAETTAAAADSANDRTIDLSYTHDEEPIALARLFVLDDTTTFGQIRAGSWPAVAEGDAWEIKDDDAVSFAATSGSVGFDDEYSAGSTFFAAAGAGGAVGGVFRFNGSYWSERTIGDADCDTSIDSLSIAGNGSNTRMVASLTASNLVCRSTNEGSSWSDTNADGGDNVCEVCRIDSAGAVSRVAANRSNPETVYYTTSGARGGVAKSTNSGSGWSDTGLTNQAYVVTSVDENSSTSAFAVVTDRDTDVDAFFSTETYGQTAGWTRSLRTSRSDLTLSRPPDFEVAQTAYARFSGATSQAVIRTTDGGRTWDETGSDPFEAGPENNEVPVTSSARSATTYYVGGDKGHVSVTTDGGNSWSILAKDFGERIDEFDFADATTFFVTAVDTDTTLKVWQTLDGGNTFTQVGNTPWGTGNGSIDTVINGYNPAENSGHLLVRTGGAVATDEIYRIEMGQPTWTDLDMDVVWTTMLGTSSVAVGDGTMVTLWANTGSVTGGALFTTFHPFTGHPGDFDPNDAADSEHDNLLLALPLPPVASGTMGTSVSPDGYTLQTTAGGRVVDMTITNAVSSGVTLTQPADNAIVAPNVGSEGIPVVFGWDDVPGADTYELMIGQQPTLSDAVILAASTNLRPVQSFDFPLVNDNLYYWRVRVKTAEAAVFEGPWSPTRSFRVGTVTTTLNLNPTNALPGGSIDVTGAGFGGSETITLIWDNPFTMLGTAATNGNGDFTTQITVPVEAPAGSHIVRALGEGSNKAASAAFTVDVAPPDSPELHGKVALQVMGNPATDSNEQRWANYPITVTLYPAGSSTPVLASSTMTDRLGNFALAVDDLPAGNYDVRVKGAHTLSNQKNNLALPQPGGAPPVDFGTLKAGDLSNNDAMDGADYSIMVTNFATVGGPVVLPRLAGGSDHADSAPPQFAVVPAAQHMAAGAIIPVDLRLRAGAQPVDSVNLTVVFPPEVLQAVTPAGAAVATAQAGESLPVVLANSVDNERGVISFAAGRQPLAQPPSGEITVARLYFKALAAVDAPLPVAIAQTSGLGSAAFFQGQPLTQP